MRALFAANAAAQHSAVHQLDVRTKILICLIASVEVLLLKSPEPLGFLTLISALYVLELRRFTVIVICYIAISIMWMISIGFMYLMHQISPMIPVSEPSKMLIPFLRTAVMLNTVLALALSSRVQTLLTSLKTLRLPIWLYLPSAVMIRFIPTFIKDVQQIHETMRIRGYSLNPLFMLVHPLLAVRLLAAPILFRALRSSDDLGIAAELKGVGYGATMESYKPQFFKASDVFALWAVFAVTVATGFIQLSFSTVSTGLMP
ncbi:MAG: cobalt transporter [Deltaproteobacteria bacterium]|nr:MAG: cobalt transporter [Deltaproteobacteria bacterium]